MLDKPVSNLEFERERKSERTLRLDLDCLAVILIVYVDHYERRFDRLRWVCSQGYTSSYFSPCLRSNISVEFHLRLDYFFKFQNLLRINIS